LHDVRAVQVAFVLQHLDEPAPRSILLVPRISALLKYSRDVQVFHEQGVVRLDEPRCEFVLEIFDFPLDSTLELGNVLTLPTVSQNGTAREFWSTNCVFDHPSA